MTGGPIGADGAGSRRAGLRLALLLVIGPLALLFAADRALVLWPAHWAWVAREAPPLVVDPYRVEAVLRATPRDRRSVPILGNSIADRGLDSAMLEQRFAAQALRFPKATLGGSPALTYGMLADAVADLEPRAAIFVASAPALRTRTDLGRVHAYDVRAVPELFSAAEVLADPSFHLDGLVGELSIFARHRRALRQVALVRLGRVEWRQLEFERDRAKLEELVRGGGDEAWEAWLRDRVADDYPNANSRALARLARKLRERGGRLIVIDAPVHPIPLLLGARRRIPPYREALRALALAEDFDLIGADQLPDFDEDHFDDWVHLNERGRDRLTAAVADTIGPRLAESP